MKVAFDISTLLGRKSGIGIYSEQIISRVNQKLFKSDYDTCGLAFDFLKRNDSLNKLSLSDMELELNHYIPYQLYNKLWKYVPIPYDSLFKNKADIYHFFNFIVPPIKGGVVITTIYDMVFYKYPETMDSKNYKLLLHYLKSSISRADKIITISQNTKNEILEYFPEAEGKMDIVYPAVDTDIYCEKNMDNEVVSNLRIQYRLPEEFILYLGTIEPRKNIERLVRAYKLALDKNKDLPKLILAGELGWQYTGLIGLIEALRLREQVLFIGYVEEKDKPDLYRLAKAFVFPSLYEGFGIPVLEAMATGIPVLTANISSLPEVAGDSTILVNPNSIEEISDGIKSIVYNENIRNNIVRKGLEQSKKFSWDQSADALFEIYKSLSVV